MPTDAHGRPADLRPRCPHCGEPARKICGQAKVTAELGADLSIIRTFRVEGFSPDSSYICGGGHKWHKEVSNEEDG